VIELGFTSSYTSFWSTISWLTGDLVVEAHAQGGEQGMARRVGVAEGILGDAVDIGVNDS
jgi:hypothetical protein